MKKKIVLVLVAIAICTGSYLGWQWKQTYDYTQKVVPLYQSMEAISSEILASRGKGGVYVDLIDEAKKLDAESKVIKRQLSAIIPTTDKSKAIHDKMNELINHQSEMLFQRLRHLRSELQTKIFADKHSRMMAEAESNPYVAEFIFAQLKKDSEDWKKAENEAKSGGNLLASFASISQEVTPHVHRAKERYLLRRYPLH